MSMHAWRVVSRSVGAGIAVVGVACAAVAAFAVGCSGSEAPADNGSASDAGIPRNATVTGTLDARALDTTNAYALLYTDIGDASAYSTLILIIGNRATTCDDYQKRAFANESALAFTVLTQARELVPIGTGTSWKLGDDAPDGAVDDAGHRPFEFTQLLYTTTGRDCVVASSVQGDTGTLTFTLVTSTRVQGSFDVTMKTGDHLTGTFDAPACVEATLGIPGGQPGPRIECVQ